MEVNDNMIMTTLSANQMQNIGGQQTRYITVSTNTPIKNAVHQNVIYSTNSPHGSPVILQSPSRGGTAQVFHTYTQLTNQRTPQQGVKREESPSGVYMVDDKRGPKIMRLKGNSAIVDRVVPGGNSANNGKGLRHFSMKVCEQVRKRGKTTYNEVADELVNEFSERGSGTSASYDQRNIRRRVYDALNVLMAMGIIEKKHKEIHWLGLPTNSAQECVKLEEEKRQRLTRIAQKTQQLYDLIIQHISYKNLIEKNKSEALIAPPAPHSTISLPFIIINTSKKTVIDCQISNDKRDYLFNFDNSFEIHDDIEVLRRMGLALGLDKGTATSESVQMAKTMVPKSLQPFVEQLARSRDELPPGMMKLNKANLSVTEEAVISILPSPSSEEAYSDEEQMGYA